MEDLICGHTHFELTLPVGNNHTEGVFCTVNDLTKIKKDLPAGQLTAQLSCRKLGVDPCRNEIGVETQIVRGLSFENRGKRYVDTFLAPVGWTSHGRKGGGRSRWLIGYGVNENNTWSRAKWHSPELRRLWRDLSGCRFK